MLQPNRTYSANKTYRYGFNGKEMDNEVKGTGAQYDYGFRIYDPRIVKFLSVDPLSYSYPYYTPYQFAGNMPLAAIDLDGLEQYVVTYYKDQNNETTKIEVRAIFDNDDLKTPLDQNIHKVNDPEKKKIALGNVLVFEIKKDKNGKETMSLVDKRNKTNSKLTKQEANIFVKTKANLEKESLDISTLTYGTGKPNSKSFKGIYISQDFENSETQTYDCKVEIAPPSEHPPEKKDIKIGVATFYTPTSPGEKKSGYGGDQTAPVAAKEWFARCYAMFIKVHKLDSVILDPVIKYNFDPKGQFSEKLDISNVITIPKKL